MNVKEYISSGILEAYVTGALSREEIAEVERNLRTYPELREELRLIEATQEAMLMKTAVAPPFALKEELLERIPENNTKVVELQHTRSVAVWRFAAAASISIAVIASLLAFTYWKKWRSAETDLTALIAQNQRVALEYNQVNERIEKLEEDISIIDNPGFQKVIMKGTPNAPQALASVYWNESTKEVFLRVQTMKQLAQENQYQLWAIIDGKPVDAGVFDGDLSGLIKMKDIDGEATTFAVTVEPRGGKESPTLETMQVAGNVKEV